MGLPFGDVPTRVSVAPFDDEDEPVVIEVVVRALDRLLGDVAV
jgi:hypothetical protein